MDILEILIQYIIDSGLYTRKDEDICKNYAPEDKPNITSVYEIRGTRYHHYSGMSTRRVQFVVRNKSLRIAQDKAWELFRLFDKEEMVINLCGIVCPYQVKAIPSRRYVDDKGLHHVQFDINFVVNNRI